MKNWFKSGKGIKTLGIVGTFLGIGATLLSNYVSEKQTEDKITQKVNEALANKN